MELNEKTLSSEVVYDGKIVRLTKDVVLLQNGKEVAREVIKHPGGVCVIALTDEDDVIFVRQFRYPHKKALREIPAGKLEYGEDPLECGKRELLEETGYTAKKFEYLGEMLPTPAYCGEVIHMYLARELEAGEQKLDDNEFLDVEKIPFDKAIDMIFHNEITDGKTQLAMLKAKILLNN
ncbi:MAG: NUDIX hydrolase [Oscillospiraceae bacterium]|jgi:ADP-ribose pyrophosphatase|nr:NUDIX hydrolase [Oscillospiraceae bacterium]